MLEVIATGVVRSPSDVERYVKSTLLAATSPFNEVVEFTKRALTWLGKKEQGYIVWDPEKQEYRATNIGVAVQSSGLPPEICIDIMADLNRAREALVLASDLHLTYICVPLNEDIHVDWQRLLQIVNALSVRNLFFSLAFLYILNI
jgi:DNA polymerase theta